MFEYSYGCDHDANGYVLCLLTSLNYFLILMLHERMQRLHAMGMLVIIFSRRAS